MIDEKCFPPQTLKQIERNVRYLHLKDKYPAIDKKHIWNYTISSDRSEKEMVEAYYPPLSLVKHDQV